MFHPNRKPPFCQMTMTICPLPIDLSLGIWITTLALENEDLDHIEENLLQIIRFLSTPQLPVLVRPLLFQLVATSIRTLSLHKKAIPRSSIPIARFFQEMVSLHRQEACSSSNKKQQQPISEYLQALVELNVSSPKWTLIDQSSNTYFFMPGIFPVHFRRRILPLRDEHIDKHITRTKTLTKRFCSIHGFSLRDEPAIAISQSAFGYGLSSIDVCIS